MFFGWVQIVVILVLIAVMFAPIVFNKINKRREDDVVYGHRVHWDE